MNIKTQNKINKLIDIYNKKQNKFEMLFEIESTAYLKYNIKLKNKIDNNIYFVSGATSQQKIIDKIKKLISETKGE